MYRIVFNLDDRENRYELPEGLTTIGRSSSCDVVINEPSVSGKHLQIEVSGKIVTCKDLQSSNGTIVNRSKVSASPLVHGDKIKLGRFSIWFEDIDLANQQHDQNVQAINEGLMEAAQPQAPAPERTETPDFLPSVSEPSYTQHNDEQNDSEGKVPSPAAVEVMPPMIVSEEDSTKVRKRPKNKKMLYAIIGMGVVLLAVILLVPTSEKPAPPPQKYNKTLYWKDVFKGIEFFNDEKYSITAQTLSEAASKWDKDNPEKMSGSMVARRLSRIAKELADAQESRIYADVEWADIARDTRNLIDDASMPDEVLSFTQDLRKSALAEATYSKNYIQGKGLFDNKDYLKSIDVLSLIPRKSFYYNESASLIRQARELDYDLRIKEIRNKVSLPNCNWAEIVEESEPLLQLKDNPRLRKEIESWRENARQQILMSNAKEYLEESNKTESLNKALNIYKAIEKTSPFYKEAQQNIETINSRLTRLQISALYNAGDATGLKELAQKNPELKAEPQYIRIMSKVKSILKNLDSAEKNIRNKKYFKARENWEAVTVLEPSARNVFNVEAQAKLREWSLEKLGNLLLEKGQEALKEGNYSYARKAFETASSRCGIDVDLQIKALRKLGYDLYIKAQMLRSQKQYTNAYETASKAKDCLLPDKDKLYPKVIGLLRELKTKGAF